MLGPTGVGKSEVAIEVAERLGGEIVGCDALQVYREFDAATAKPSAADLARVRHHLIDRIDPREDFSLADYVRAADDAIAEIVGRGRVPVVAGGTGMYLRGLLRGVIEAPPRDEALRARIRAWIARRGSERAHRVLARLDPATARRIGPGDRQRLVRALEVAVGSGRSLGARIEAQGTWASGRERYRSVKFGLDLDRPALAERLARRVDDFFAAGLIEEVRAILAAGVPASANAFKAIGYRQTLAALRSGAVDRVALRDEIVVRTRQFAKRQRTWFRGESDIEWLDAGNGARAVADTIVARWTSEAGAS